jgi:hypothetical protein
MPRQIDERWFDFICAHKNRTEVARIINMILASQRLSAVFLRFTGKNLSEVIRNERT